MTTYTEFEAVSSKVCTVCGLEKAASEFYRTRKSRDGFLSRCKECHSSAVCERQKEIPEQINLKNARWKRINREKVNASQKKRRNRLRSEGKLSSMYRRHDLTKHYGVTPAWYDAKLAEQNGGCGICGATTSGATGRRMHVDHCHATDCNRGILCHRCNVTLERIESVPDWSEKARAYLARYAESS